MNTKRTVFLISGPPGSGKSTLADKVCGSINGLCVHIEGDQLYNMVRKGWVHPCDDHDNFFLNILWDNIVALIENFTKNDLNVVTDYVFSAEQLSTVIDRIKNLNINIKVIVIKSEIETLIKRDRQRSGVAHVGEERIRQIVRDFNSNKFPERLILDNNDSYLEDLVNIVLNEDRFTVN
ncbi:AAA family ATPase [Thalassobacillus pellis]|uniref:AAA family ATPase n=1 Tax=Thalassobacillus pellis TaxID=748008 RepID=UPI001960F479|nr:AAA family ATPase [Thalassobacillus pellis]MBM7553968.1 adenylate kinase family enzyme [Thalassobacillus pellis]